jgi:hypothetical protein
MRLDDVNVNVTINPAALREFVRAVAERLARDLSHKINAFVDVDVASSGDSCQTILTITFDNGQTGKVIVAPIIQGGIIPVTRSGQIGATSYGVSSADEKYIKDHTEQLSAEILPRFVLRMIEIGLR